jgi:hypothetical protein
MHDTKGCLSVSAVGQWPHWLAFLLLSGKAQSVTRLRGGWPQFDSRQGKTFLFVTASRPALGPTQHLTHYVPGFFPASSVRRPGREADHPAPSSVEVGWSRHLISVGKLVALLTPPGTARVVD